MYGYPVTGIGVVTATYGRLAFGYVSVADMCINHIAGNIAVTVGT